MSVLFQKGRVDEVALSEHLGDEKREEGRHEAFSFQQAHWQHMEAFLCQCEIFIKKDHGRNRKAFGVQQQVIPGSKWEPSVR